MSTIRTDAGQAPVDVTVDEAHAIGKALQVNASTAERTDATGASEGTATQHTESAAILPA